MIDVFLTPMPPEQIASEVDAMWTAARETPAMRFMEANGATISRMYAEMLAEQGDVA